MDGVVLRIDTPDAVGTTGKVILDLLGDVGRLLRRANDLNDEVRDRGEVALGVPGHGGQLLGRHVYPVGAADLVGVVGYGKLEPKLATGDKACQAMARRDALLRFPSRGTGSIVQIAIERCEQRCLNKPVST